MDPQVGHDRYDPDWTPEDVPLNQAWRNTMRISLPPFQELGRRSDGFVNANLDVILDVTVSTFGIVLFQVALRNPPTYPLHPALRDSLYLHLTGRQFDPREHSENLRIY